MLSIVVPVFDEETCIAPFLAALHALALPREIEIVFVDDGSTDGTLAAIKSARQTDAAIRYVSFSRNFGKEAALFAGLSAARGDLVVTMDVDLQHDPSLLTEMLKAVESEGYDSAAACRTSRSGEPPLRSWFAHRFYSLMNRCSDVRLKDGAMDYRLMTRQVVETVLSLKESNRFTKGIYEWVGFKTKWLECSNLVRREGRSKWSFRSLVGYSMRGILAFSTAPLQLASVLGLLMAMPAFFYMMWVFFKYLAYRDPVAGWPTLICTILMLGGLQLFVIGILGLYIAGIFRETKGRPIYVVKESV